MWLRGDWFCGGGEVFVCVDWGYMFGVVVG